MPDRLVQEGAQGTGPVGVRPRSRPCLPRRRSGRVHRRMPGSRTVGAESPCASRTGAQLSTVAEQGTGPTAYGSAGRRSQRTGGGATHLVVPNGGSPVRLPPGEPGLAFYPPVPLTLAQRPAPEFLAACIFLASFSSLRSFTLSPPVSRFCRSRRASSGVSRMQAGAILGSTLGRSAPRSATTGAEGGAGELLVTGGPSPLLPALPGFPDPGCGRARRLLGSDRSDAQSVAPPFGVAGVLQVLQCAQAPQFLLVPGGPFRGLAPLVLALRRRSAGPAVPAVAHHTPTCH